MHISIERKLDGVRGQHYAAVVDRHAEFMGSSPDEALGYAIRERVLTHPAAVHDPDGAVRVPLELRIHFLASS